MRRGALAILCGILCGLSLPPAAGAAEPADRGSLPIDLRSQTLTVDHKNRRATFGGGVVATRGDMEIACPELVAWYDARGQVREVVCNGPIVATQGARRMEAREGRFDNATGVLTLSGQPTLTEGARRIVGNRLVYDADTEVAELETVQGELPAAEAAAHLPGAAGRGPVLVSAPRARHDFQRQRSVFEGGIVARRGDLVLEAPRLTATYDEAGELARARTGGGPVTVQQGARRGRADRATFTAGARTLVLEGDPEVREGASSLSGEKVTFLLGQDRVEVERPRAVFPVGAATGGSR